MCIFTYAKVGLQKQGFELIGGFAGGGDTPNQASTLLTLDKKTPPPPKNGYVVKYCGSYMCEQNVSLKVLRLPYQLFNESRQSSASLL